MNRFWSLPVLTESHDMSFGVNGPGIHTGGALDVQLFVDQPAMRENETWLSAIGISSTPDNLMDVGVIPVIVTRTEPNPIRATALFKDQTRAVVLPPAGVHDRLFVDVPPRHSAPGYRRGRRRQCFRDTPLCRV